MAVHLDYDTDKRIIYVTTAPVNGVFSLNAKIDIYSDMKEDWKTDPTLNKLRFPLFEPVGGNPVTPAKSISPYYFLKYGWVMRPYEADHTLYIENGYLLIDGGGDPWIKTIGGHTVNVRDSVPADSFVLTASTSITEQDKLDIANRVWVYATRSLTTFGSLVSDIWSYSTRTITSFGTLVADIAAAVWDTLIGNHVSAGSTGETVALIKQKTDTIPPDIAGVSDIPTEAEITADIDANSTQLAAIKAKTDNLPVDPAGVSDVPTAEENALELLDNQNAP